MLDWRAVQGVAARARSAAILTNKAGWIFGCMACDAGYRSDGAIPFPAPALPTRGEGAKRPGAMAYSSPARGGVGGNSASLSRRHRSLPAATPPPLVGEAGRGRCPGQPPRTTSPPWRTPLPRLYALQGAPHTWGGSKRPGALAYSSPARGGVGGNSASLSRHHRSLPAATPPPLVGEAGRGSWPQPRPPSRTPLPRPPHAWGGSKAPGCHGLRLPRPWGRRREFGELVPPPPS
jgi:hypothetical protein